MTPFDTIYQNLLKDIMKKGIAETNARTGHETKALPGLTFSLDIAKQGFPLLTLREIPIQLFVAEQVWFISGSRKPADFLRQFTKIWDIFTNPGDVVTVAYGYRWRKHFGRDQLKLLIDLLKKDPSSRHGVVVMWDPSSDGLGGINKKNVPCPYTFTVNIIGGKLHLHLIVRSNDMILGFPHDVAGFALLQCILAQELEVIPGIYTHTISNAHVYDIHYPTAKEIISRKNKHKKVTLTLPLKSFSRSEKKDADLVKEIATHFKKQYKPAPAIKGLKIVL
jgi:thymidylate synthase